LTKEIKRLRKKSSYVIKEARRIIRKYGRKLDSAQMEPLVTSYAALSNAIENGDNTSGEIEFKQLEHLLETDFAFARKSAIREWAESLFVALIIAMFLRTFVLEAFKIPSGSMIPTLLVGDHIFVNKFVYGIRLPFMSYRLTEWSEPKHGDVIVFAYPHDPDKDYIKRVIGVPGDHIEMRGQDLFVNGEIVKMSESEPYTYTDETTGGMEHAILRHAMLGNAQFNIIYDESRLHPTMEYTVEPRHLFVMGDNRDNSADSRAWGQVPYDNVKGRAIVVWWSHSEHEGIRFDRMGHLID
jgi:signal peptidase I